MAEVIDLNFLVLIHLHFVERPLNVSLFVSWYFECKSSLFTIRCRRCVLSR